MRGYIHLILRTHVTDNYLALLICVLATQIFDLLENELPADFNRKFGLSWNLLKASLASKPGKDLMKFHWQ